ncbi:MAG: C10 family peptidase, partial [Bacteroidales bacterium]|nr:C10 family peptidase [Bacteroidales bacterium]
MKKFILFLMTCAMAMGLSAQSDTRNSSQNDFPEKNTHVTAAQALEVGYTFMRRGGNERGNAAANGNVSRQSMQLVYTGTAIDGSDCYYVFSLQPRGFVIVAADEHAEPILGYSYDNPFSLEGMPDNVRYWLDQYGQQIKAAVDNDDLPSTEIAERWSLLKSGQPMPNRSITAVSPLIQTTWNQDNYYNQFCPADANGPGGHVYAGCVATALAQIIRYWQWPNQGFNSHSYDHSTYGTLSVDFNSATYNYNNMPNSLSSSSTSTQKNAVAKLIYHCGVAVDMDYSTIGSSAFFFPVPSVLYNYFAFEDNGTYVYKSDYSDSDWANLLKQELNNARPVFYSGQGNGGGHAFVCDGYDNSGNFHFNWGWGGYNDGYFALNALTPSSYNYSQDQEAIIGISATGSFIRCSTSQMVLNTYDGVSSSAQTLSVRGHSLSGNISVTTGNGFLISTNGTDYSTSASLSSTGGTLYVKYSPTASSSDTEYTMTLTSGSCSANVTLYGSSSTEPCIAPKNLTGTRNGSSVDLSWNVPVTYSSGSPNSVVISWGSSSNISSYYGYGVASQCMVQRFETSDLTPYNQYLLKAVWFIGSPYATSYKVVVFKGGSCNNGSLNSGEQVVNQVVPMSTVNTTGWTVVTLTNPVLVDATSELWFGVVATGDYVIPYVEGEAISNKGNIIGLTFEEGATEFSWYGNLYPSNIPLGGTLEKISAQVLQYDVYRQNTLIGSTTNTTYTDNNPLNSSCTYTVSAVWNNNCSESATVTVSAPATIPPTVTTDNVTNIGTNSASCGGNVTNDGYGTVTARGICWSTSPNPTISGYHTSNGSGTGSFTGNLSGLKPNTTYYVRAYATNSAGTGYGTQKTFTTSCNTVNVRITGTTSIGYGQSTTLNASGATSYSWNTGSTSSSITVSPTSTSTYSVTGSNQYGCTATASVTVTVNYPPTVTTNSISDITKNSAICGGNVTADGGASVTARGVCWSTSQSPTISDSHTSDGTGTGTFTSTITGLGSGLTYYVRAYATNSAGTAYGNVVSFTTFSCPDITLPYLETFESFTSSTTTTTGVEPTCWELVRTDAPSMPNDKRPQVYYRSDFAHSGSYSLLMNYRCVYALPEISGNVPMNNVKLDMYLRQPNAAYQLQVGVWDDATSTFEPVALFNNTTTGVEHVTCDFSGYSGNGKRIAFRNVLGKGSYAYSYNYLDDITLTEMEDCSITLPYTENFDGYTSSTTTTTGMEPTCWELVRTDAPSMPNDKRPQVFYRSDFAHSGSYSLLMNYRCVYALPEISGNVPMNNVKLDMYLRQ